MSPPAATSRRVPQRPRRGPAGTLAAAAVVTVALIGAAASLNSVIKFSDAMILALVFPNMLGLLLLFPKVRAELKRYTAVTDEADRQEG